MVKITPHHRRPRSLGGLNVCHNIAYIEEIDHRAWHTMFGNMNAYQICNLINKLPESYKPSNLFLVCDFINGSSVEKCGLATCCSNPSNEKFYFAWKRLFGKMKKFESIISYINNTFFDPSYHIYVKYL